MRKQEIKMSKMDLACQLMLTPDLSGIHFACLDTIPESGFYLSASPARGGSDNQAVSQATQPILVEGSELPVCVGQPEGSAGQWR